MAQFALIAGIREVQAILAAGQVVVSTPVPARIWRWWGVVREIGPRRRYRLFPNPVVAESILDRVLNSAHHLYMPGRSYRPQRRPSSGSSQMTAPPEATEIAAVIHDLRRLSDRDPDALAHRDEILATKRHLLDRIGANTAAADHIPAETPATDTPLTTATATTWARPDCDQPVTRNKRGRPATYCSPACRPSGQRRRPSRPGPQRQRPPLTVEIDHPETSPDGRPAERVWTDTLRRGPQAVTIANDLG